MLPVEKKINGKIVGNLQDYLLTPGKIEENKKLYFCYRHQPEGITAQQLETQWLNAVWFQGK